jgi:hypothetical protein
MADFSFGQAIGAGFGVVARKPLVLLVWTVAYLVLVTLPTIALMIQGLPEVAAGVRDAAKHAVQGAAPSLGQFIAIQSRIAMLQWAVWLVQIISYTILAGAIFRAVLEPTASKWGYLRLSGQEFWLFLTNLACGLLAILSLLTLSLPLQLGAAIANLGARQGHGPGPGAIWSYYLIGFGGLGLIFWMASRLCLALPLAFDQRRFALSESLKLTRGLAAKMFATALALLLIVWLSQVGFRALGQVIGMQGVVVHLTSGAAKASPPVVVGQLVPLVLGYFGLTTLISMTVLVIVVAPMASIYQQLGGRSASA